MDGNSSMGVQSFNESHQNDETPDVDEEEVDFYSHSNALAFGATQNSTNGSMQSKISSPSLEQQKLDNQKKAEALRAKLIAKRQNTPVRTTPLQQDKDDNDYFGLESLLAEGKAAAEAKMKQKQSAPAAEEYPKAMNTEDAIATPQQSVSPGHAAENTSKQPSWATKLTDTYYSDLSIWLEVTGYHDVEFRNSKLRTHKERKALEQEAARIAKRLEKLKQEEQTTIKSIRASPVHTTAIAHPPPLPTHMPNADITNHNQTTPSNSVKRARSPEPAAESKNKSARTTESHPNRRPSQSSPVGLERRISYPDARRQSVDQHNNDNGRLSGISAPSTGITPFRAESRPYERASAARDPSLERRRQYYKTEQSSPAPAAFGLGRDGRDTGDGRYDRYVPARPSRHTENRSRLGYSSVRLPARQATTPGGRAGGYRDDYRGSSGLDLRKGGVRYFMIKSWNHENVQNAMRDNLWATQVKNSMILTEAYERSRFVVLLFSVNKSMAFQGYALMTSPPTPSLPKPGFCAKLNWDTSPAFTLKWLAKTPVHFKFVGHLKNEFNLDEEGKAMAVLVGKDGQEISSEAGMGVVGVLDDVADQERGRRLSA